ncbi:MAG: hypothetical protein FWE07_05630 [Turicibacter sp.]|nr:hypothetical protein [Turicibacter sp.]
MIIENYMWLGILVFTCTVDFVIMYVLAHNIGGHKLEIKWWHWVMMVLFGAVVAAFMYFGEGFSLFRLVGRLLMFVVLKTTTKRKIFDILLIYVVMLPIIFIAQTVFIAVSIMLNLDVEFQFLVGQSLTAISIFALLWQLRLNKIFLMIKQKFILTFGAITLFALIYSFGIIFQFNIHSAFENLFWFSLLGVIVLGSFFTAITMVQRKIEYTSAKYHDLVNKFNGLFLAIESSNDPEEIRALSRDMQKYITGRERTEALSTDYNESFKILLREKLAESKKENELVLEIGYHEHHATVSFGDVTYMLGTLFDNALDHGLDGPILVYLNVCANILELSVKNPCLEMPPKKLSQIFRKGVSSKEGIGHGQGLYQLKKAVEGYHRQPFTAKIEASCYHDLSYQQDFLEITIDISTW